MTTEARPRRFVVGGNWKMNGDQRSVLELCRMLSDSNLDPSVEVVIGVPSIYIMLARKNLSCSINIAGQNAYTEPKGAFTGEISPAMLKDVCANWVILGHSERRQLFGESDDFVAQKMAHATEQGLSVIGCIGETLEERNTNKMEEVLARQMCAYAKKTRDWSNVVIAYEPIWAIGTGVTATPQQAQEVHQFLRQWLTENMSPEIAQATRIQYGGSVNAANCKELASMADIDGFLVGGASLKPEFVDIINCRRL